MEITDDLVGKITNRNERKEGKIRAKEHRERKKMYRNIGNRINLIFKTLTYIKYMNKEDSLYALLFLIILFIKYQFKLKTTVIIFYNKYLIIFVNIK